MRRIILSLFGLGALALGLSQAAGPTKITFWHYIGEANTADTVKAFAKEFNASQSKYSVEVMTPGSFNEIGIKLQAALSAKSGVPSMVQIDNGFFTRLALSGQLEDLTPLANAMPKATVQDFYTPLWEYGEVNDRRLGLPWAASTLVNAYNADAFRAKGLAAPRTWDDYIKAAKALTSRTSKGAIFFADGWIFASMVASRGGNVLTKDNKPDFNNAGSVQTLQMMYDLTRSGNAIVRNFNEANFAVIDWVRTKSFMVTVPISAYPYVKNTMSFQVGAAPMPGRTLAGESQIVILKTDDTEAKGAFDFWNYMIRPENAARLSKAGYYLPVRRSTEKLLGNFMDDPIMKAGFEALEKAYNPPHLIEYQNWRSILEGQLERSLKGGIDPKLALNEVQRQAITPR
jgi:sn-glycerol 3-phosphate transport system substrate-binding protein